MAKAARSSEKVPKSRAALTPEAREKQLIALAIDVAEEQMRNGTASSQVISHFLKLGSTRAQIEKELLEKQRDLAAAKAEAIESSAKMEDLYLKAAKAMKSYQGQEDEEDALYEDFGVLKEIIGDPQIDLVVPASLWIDYLSVQKQ